MFKKNIYISFLFQFLTFVYIKTTDIMSDKQGSKAYIVLITFISALGGLLFGYDWDVIGGAKPFYEAFFGIQRAPAIQGFVMASSILGCLLGVTTTGWLADRYGRKPLLAVASVIFIISAVGTGTCNTLPWFIFYRLIGGIAIGVASNLSPMYLAEVSPAEVRGRFVSVNQLTIVLGILSAQIASWLIAEPTLPDSNILASWNGQTGWRIMFWAELVPAVLFFILIFFVPESPRWLGTQLKYEQSRRIFIRIGGQEYANSQIEPMKSVSTEGCRKKGYRMLFQERLGKILLTGIVIAIFQQWCGVNVVFNYAQEIFQTSGYGVSDILFNIFATGVTNVVFTFVGIYTVDRLGQRALLLLGAAGLAVIYAVLGACYYFQVPGLAELILVITAIAAYAMTLTPVTWAVISEIFPNRVRGAAMGIVTFALWTACFVLTYTFPVLNNNLGPYGTFWFYGVICLLEFAYLWKNLPETKEKSLKEIERELSTT